MSCQRRKPGNILNIALLGAGRIGEVHAKTVVLNGDCRFVAVADAHTHSAEPLAAQIGAKVRSVEDILADDGIDAVLIASSTDTHSDLITRATAAGKPVMIGSTAASTQTSHS